MSKRNGNMRKRNDPSRKRTPKLGYYIIFTDTVETECNYIKGFRDSIPNDTKNNIVIIVRKVNTVDLLDKAISEVTLQTQYRQPWIIFDRDEVDNFDKIISDATEKGVKVGWSNPCIETWFHAHFENPPNVSTSRSCISKFGTVYKNNIKQRYEKNDESIYKKLQQYGDEKTAIEKMRVKKNTYLSKKPSDMQGYSSIHELIDEINGKTKKSNYNQIKMD